MIRGGDRVSEVLAAKPSLLEVFVSVSPAFSRLRNPALRRVMARLVTVEQAARVAGVEPALLLARLNEEMGAAQSVNWGVPTEQGGNMQTVAGAASKQLEEAIRTVALTPERVVELDVREELRAGREPFSLIMGAVRQVPAGGALMLRAIFEPVPLYDVLKRRGFAHWTEQRAPDDWVIWFLAEEQVGEAGSPRPAAAAPMAPGADPVEELPDTVVLDVRGLEPPEPMARTLAALESLPAGATLVQLNARVPQFLIPLLEERGFQYEVREQGPDLVRLFIRRTGD
jgi:uncharacterized protein (DUF2249 family)